MKLTLFQHAFHEEGNRPDGASYATKAEAEAAAIALAREVIETYFDSDDTESMEQLAGYLAEFLHADATLEDLGDSVVVEFAEQFVPGFESDIYEVGIEIGAEALLAAAVGGLVDGAGVSAAAYMITGVYLARQTVKRWASGDLAATINALEEWADEVQRDFPGLDFDRDPVSVSVLEIGPGDLVDLQGAPGCDGESFIGAEFEFAVCIGAERESPDCVRLDFADYPSVGFDAAVSLPVIKATAEESAKWAE